MRLSIVRISAVIVLIISPIGGALFGFPNLWDSYPANVNGLALDRTVLRGKNQSRLVKVWTLAADPEGDVLVYNYTVTGGKILNAEPNSDGKLQTFAVSGSTLEKSRFEVIWDLSDVPPGEYSITAGVDDGCGLCGQTKTQTVVVDPKPEMQVSVCPSAFDVVWSKTFMPRQPVRFLAVPSNGQRYEAFPPVRWNLPANSIIAGNGSPLIDIVANRKQHFVAGTFVRDPQHIAPRCDFSGEFNAELFKYQRR